MKESVAGLAAQARLDASQAVTLYAFGSRDEDGFVRALVESSVDVLRLLRQILESSEPELPDSRDCNRRLLTLTCAELGRRKGTS